MELITTTVRRKKLWQKVDAQMLLCLDLIFR